MKSTKFYQQVREHPFYFFSFLLLAIPLFYLAYQFNKANDEEIIFSRDENEGLKSLLSLNRSYIAERNAILKNFEVRKSGNVADFENMYEGFEVKRDVILDQSNLILDPEKETYHLIVSSQKLSYDLEESLISIYLIFLQNPDYDFKKIIKSKDASLSKTIISRNISDALSSYKKFCSDECPDYFKSNLENYQKVLNSFINSEFSIGKLSEKSNELTHFLEISDSLRLESNSLISKNLIERMDKYKFRQKSVLIATFILWLLSIISSFIFYSINLNRIKDYVRQIQNQNEELEKSRKLSLIGELAAGIGHEINNPLSIAQVSLELINRKIDIVEAENDPNSIEDIRDLLKRIEKMILNIRQIVRSFKSYVYSGDDEAAALISLNEAIGGALLLVQYKAYANGVAIQNEIKEEFNVLGTLHGIEQILVNIFNNAVDAMEKSSEKKILIEASRESGFLNVDISDTGSGVPDELKEKIFNPLFTTKKANVGTGLGLGLAKKICGKFGGDLILVESERGAKFRIKLKV
ncbi:MAG: sensor histidine kinase [Bdellovibrio sp.]